jgi:hypothetical protein
VKPEFIGWKDFRVISTLPLIALSGTQAPRVCGPLKAVRGRDRPRMAMGFPDPRLNPGERAGLVARAQLSVANPSE